MEESRTIQLDRRGLVGREFGSDPFDEIELKNEIEI